METLFRSFRTQLEHTSTEVVRFLHDQIAWDSRLVAILGARGVGKTTLLLQHIKLYDREDESLYVTADDFYFTKYRLFDMAYQFYNLGGKKLYIDEIHKYKDWSREVKNIYDQIPGLQVIYTGSSILDLEKGGADLSRRKVEYRLPGLSFREYLNISQGWQLPSYSLEEILAGKVEFPYKEARPLKLFNDYLLLRRIIAFWGDLSLCSRPHFAALRLLYLTLQATVQVAYLIINIIELQFSPCTFLLPIREIFIPFPGFSRYDVPFTNHFLSSFHCFFVGFPCFPLRKCIAIPLFHYATFCFRMSDLLNTSVSGDSSKTVRLVIIVCT